MPGEIRALKTHFKMKTVQLPDDKIEIIRQNIDFRPRTELAKMVGIGTHCLYKYLNILGAEMHHEWANHDDGIDDYIREHYPDEQSWKIAAHLGIGKSTVIRTAKRLGLKKSEAFMEWMDEITKRNRDMSHCKEVHARAMKSRSESIHRDRLRMKYGMPQKLKLKVGRIMPEKAYHARWHLIHAYNYFAVEGQPYTVGYDSKTRRNPKLEKYYTNKYKFTFMEGEESDD